MDVSEGQSEVQSEFGLYAYVVNRNDNVATAVEDLSAGSITQLTGDPKDETIVTTDLIPRGFKIALQKIEQNEPILKYGIPIGRATLSIEKGSCVHLHNMCSLADYRASNFNIHDATPEDRCYHLNGGP